MNSVLCRFFSVTIPISGHHLFSFQCSYSRNANFPYTLCCLHLCPFPHRNIRFSPSSHPFITSSCHLPITTSSSHHILSLYLIIPPSHRLAILSSSLYHAHFSFHLTHITSSYHPYIHLSFPLLPPPWPPSYFELLHKNINLIIGGKHGVIHVRAYAWTM
jgi:hypothetical protein